MTDGEATFLRYWTLLQPNLPQPIMQHRFDPTRKWRLDFAWPESGKVAVEIESSLHRTNERFGADLDKYNQLSAQGWRLFRITRHRLVCNPDAFIGMVAKALEDV